MRRRSFLTALLAGAAAPLLDSSQPEVAEAVTPRGADGSYLYCDAALLAQHWGIPLHIAKARVARKTNEGLTADLDSALRKARLAHGDQPPESCSYYENGYSYDDMDYLATFWGVDIYDAKSKTQGMLFRGERQRLSGALKSARAQALRSGQVYRDQFSQSGYQRCDALILAQAWGVTPERAKSMIGEKLYAKRRPQVERALGATRARLQHKAESLCPYWEGGYSFSDIDRLAQLWGVDAPQAKARVARKLFYGQYGVLSAQVKASYQQPRPHSHPSGERPLGTHDIEKFYNFDHTYCDAVVLARLWRTSPWEAKKIGGRKIWDHGHETLKATLHQQRKRLEHKALELCPPSDYSYRYQDMELLSRFWGVSVYEAKTLAAQRIFYGNESKLKQELKAARVAKPAGAVRAPTPQRAHPKAPPVRLKRVKRVKRVKQGKRAKQVKQRKRIKGVKQVKPAQSGAVRPQLKRITPKVR